MRWTMLLLNILAAVTFVLLAAAAPQAQRTHAYSTLREHARDKTAQSEPLPMNKATRNVGEPSLRAMSRLNSSKPLTRRTALRLASAPIVTLGLSRFVRAADKAQGFTFIAVNDLHYFDDECAPFFR